MENKEQIKSEVLELLNQALIKLQNAGEVPVIENYDYGRTQIGKKPEPEVDENGEEIEDDYADAVVDIDVELAVLKEIIGKLAKGDNGVYMLEKYYTSTCY